MSIKIPLDAATFLRGRSAMRRDLLLQEHQLRKRIAILGGSSTRDLRNALEIFLLDAGVEPEFYESEFGKYYEDLAFPNSELMKFAPDIIFIHTTEANVQNYPNPGESEELVGKKLDAEWSRLTTLWKSAEEQYHCPVIQNNFELPYLRQLGNLDFSHVSGKTNFILSLNARIAEYARTHHDFYVHDILSLSSWVGLEKWFDKSAWYSYKLAFPVSIVPAFAQNLASLIKAIFGLSKKAVVLDLDNTLWGGVIGDDGVNNIQIGKETPVAEAHTAFQGYIKALKARGVLLAVASKNEEKTAREGFSHPDSVLKTDDFASFQANWGPKSESIARIAKDLNIGVDSLVFVDDNPAERELVRQHLPNVQVPEVGDDISTYPALLDRSGLFEIVTLSRDDLSRNQYYADNARREDLEQQFSDYGEYLKSLEMIAEIAPFRAVYFDRIAQLTNKTNQFNLTTRRYTLSEIQAMAVDPAMVTLYGRLQDKFGDNGLISVIVGHEVNRQLHVDLWLMSCRVLKRGMEQAMLDQLVDACSERGISEIIGYYRPTAKNNMVAGLFDELGFQRLTSSEVETVWRLAIRTERTNTNQYIEVRHGSE